MMQDILRGFMDGQQMGGGNVFNGGNFNPSQSPMSQFKPGGLPSGNPGYGTEPPNFVPGSGLPGSGQSKAMPGMIPNVTGQPNAASMFQSMPNAASTMANWRG